MLGDSVLSLSRWETSGVAHGNDPFFPVYSMRKKPEYHQVYGYKLRIDTLNRKLLENQ
jgi:hypothetical protein